MDSLSGVGIANVVTRDTWALSTMRVHYPLGASGAGSAPVERSFALRLRTTTPSWQ
ncbi:hypothetical protein [Arthrobacter sp. B2a2-09]|uniref:hypothetical protein n=1 Tax=Arthrobacter sp. B2a2-09 TaxID=2952822 RepID=UPI0022CDA090|nr:hypothetical protein [Arthrobacter sp. B2a2-09]MCZ9881693.1 hypothetical protein [Arthrobacter sp. B2a2-09]